MKAVVQRVLSASVQVDGETVGSIGRGLLVFVGFGHDDTEAGIDPFLDRLLKLRIFEDEAGRMNRSLADVAGGLLLVSQFTLLADLAKGNRPSFGPAASPEIARHLYERMLDRAAAKHGPVAAGRFGADMKVALINDGPVTFVLP
ncbi:D-tyrosyl-tRNA(Tyr) deacylase [Leptonema illini DSM 21528]|uniref:D-aminoacyl-tRNA deacylase n=1 Tax=Leptonema illini DSM 21528 TaxID=929563 RepID=H2CLT3_9LEPT|nr:D-tyrosyl-tRNA(Tyr) deacylase [Leptonema illini DSM 21528]